MKPTNNEQGQAMIESIFMLSVSLGLLFFLICHTFIGISKRIVQWGCFRAARTLLPFGVDPRFRGDDLEKAEKEARAILKTIPFPKGEPLIRTQSTDREVTIEISQPILLLGKTYELHEKFSLAR